jgi:TonB-linked SusC/RagA family outer membrane protein
MKKVLLALSFLMVFGLGSILAQAQTISGTVTGSDDGMPIPGASVFVKGTTVGTVTQPDGTYSLNVPEDAETIVFSFVGMETQEIAYEGQSTIDASLASEFFAMDEVIVVGYGVSRKEANTGSVSNIGSESLQDVPEVSFDKMLSGKMPGVMVTGSSGQPGSSSQVRIRGISSLNAGNEPLYVVDGIPVMQGDQGYFTNSSNALAMYNPNDIESITVLKDAAAASIYGSRAANGVVLINTKNGKAGKTSVKMRTSYGVTSLTNDNDYGIMNPNQLVTYMRDAVVNAGGDPDDPTAGSMYIPKSLLDKKQINWLDALTRNGSIHEYELSVTGGNESTKHYTSGLYSKTEGTFHSIDYEKFQLRSNIDHKISDIFSMGAKINMFHSDANDVAMQDLFYANPIFAGSLILPWTPMKNDDGTYNLDIPENANTNPRATAEYDDQWEKQNRIQTTVFADAKITNSLTFKTNNSVEYTDGEGRRYWSPEADFNNYAVLQVSNSKYTQLTSSNTLTYANLLGEEHSITGILGQEVLVNDYNSYYGYGDVDPNIPFANTIVSGDPKTTVDYEQERYTMQSFFGIADYSYDGRYYLKLSLRTDGSSKFGSNYRWGTFYSAGTSWNIHNETFMEEIEPINMLKLRASYGVNGNDNIGTYEQWGVYGPVSYNGISGMAPEQPSNPDLTWEVNTSYNVGLDFIVLNRISGTLDYYNRITSDMLLDRPLSRTSGFIELRQNIGEIENKGFEALINVNILDAPVKWDIGGHIASNQSEILDLGGEEQIIDSRLIHRVGESLYSYYLRDYAGVNPANGEALWYREDGSITNVYADAERKIVGSPEPDFIGGANTNVAWNGLALAVNLEFKIGNQILIEENRYLNSDGYNWGSNQASTAVDYWKKPGDITRNPIPIANNTTNSSGFRNSRWMQDGDYLRIKNVSLSYNLPNFLIDQARLKNVRIYASATNLFTFHGVDFFDPERGDDGLGYGIYPMTKSLMGGLEITF